MSKIDDMRLLLFVLPLTISAFSTHRCPSPTLIRPFFSEVSFLWKETSPLTKLCHSSRTYSYTYPFNSPRSIMNASGGDDDKSGIVESNKLKILGVCGGIGSGKSTACQLMVDSLGCVARIDADKLAHLVYEPGSKALEEIRNKFGKDILDDTDNTQIDRKKLGAIVFNDAASMSKLEQIVWPHVRDKIEERIEEIKQEHQQQQSTSTSSEGKRSVIIVEAALLLETNWHDLFDGLWVVQSSQSVAVQRLKDNRGMTEEESLVRIRAQDKRKGIGGAGSGGEISNSLHKDGMVTTVITNDGSIEDLEITLERALSDPTLFSQ